MNPTSKCLCRVVSFLGLACALFCLWYIVTVGYGIFGSPPREDTPPQFVEWYVGLSTMAALIAMGVAVGSVGLARLRMGGVRMLTLCSLLPLPLLLMVGISWLSPMGMSIAAASGVSLGGLMPMLISLLPLWSGLLWVFAFRPPQPPNPTLP